MKEINRIRTILLNDWDPLGVGENENLSDEYDSYIPPILKLIKEDGTVEKVRDYLIALDTKWGGTPNTHTATVAAQKLLSDEI